MISHKDYIYKASLLQNMIVEMFFLRKFYFTCMSSCVSLQIESIVESLATESAEISLRVAVTLHVSVEKSLKSE